MARRRIDRIDVDKSTKFASYVRVSSKRQKDDKTIELQIQANNAAITKLGGDISQVLVFRDEAVSGYNRVASQRPAINELVDAIRSGKVDIIVFFEESRLSRRVIDFYIDIYAPINKVNPNVKFFRSSDGTYWDPSTQEAKQNLILAFQESDKKARLARQSQDHYFRVEKRRPGGRIPFGIRAITETELIPDENYPILLFIFHLASWGYSERHIAEILNMMELPDARPNDELRKTGKWVHTEIHYILNNPLYIGELALGRRVSKQNGALKAVGEYDTLPGRYNALIPQDLWRLVHVQRENKAVNKSVRTKTSFLLTGIVKCEACGVDFRTKNSLKSNAKGVVPKRTKSGGLLHYYYCPICNRRMDTDEIEDEVVVRVSVEIERFLTREVINKQIKRFKSGIHRRIKELEEELVERRYQLNQLASGYYSKMWGHDTITFLQSLASKRAMELEQMKKVDLESEKEIDSLILDPDVLARIAARVRKLSTVLPSHELRFMMLNLVDEILISISPSGTITIESITYQMLPFQYVGNRWGEVSN